MYELNDTIVAISSPSSEQRVIVRITGAGTVQICEQIFLKNTGQYRRTSLGAWGTGHERTVNIGCVVIDTELKVDAILYLFLAPYSYTGDDVAELHIHANSAVAEALIENLLSRGLRMAEPGEFTARAYLNGKIDLAQAEAVNEIIVGSNEYQLAAAEKLLAGRLAKTIEEIKQEIMDCLSLIEAGLDFSGEDIEFITRTEAVKRLVAIRDQLEQLLSGSISYESVIDLPSVGIAGAPNAGKSSLLNKLLGKERSIVSPNLKTTRDVLTGILVLDHYSCVLFDCAGLTPSLVARRPSLGSRDTGDGTRNVLDELAQQAAIEALRNSNVVVFCVDISKGFPQSGVPDWAEDIAIRNLIEPKVTIPVATKCDLLCEEVLSKRLAELNEIFALEFLPLSAQTGSGIELLRKTLNKRLTEKSEIPRASGIALTARHKRAVTEAINNVSESIDEVKKGNDEVTAMMLRAAYQAVCDIAQPADAHIDDQILEHIFSRFCIGK